MRSVCRLFRVHGQVQGVWFRASARQEAERLGITGYAANCPDGTVEVLACGSEQALSSFENWLHKGPPLAQVGEVEREATDTAPPPAFTIG